MKKNKKIAIVLIAIIVLSSIAMFVVLQFSPLSRSAYAPTNSSLSTFASGGELDESSIVYGRSGTAGGYTPLILDAKNCQVGRDAVYFGFGHTEFLVIGKQNISCVFEYGTEIESPNWDGTLDTRCEVPSTQPVTLTVSEHGIDFSPISEFCSKK